MIKIFVGNAVEQNTDVICNAANGLGYPMGRGIAGAIKRAGGEIISRDAGQICDKNKYVENGITKFGYPAGKAYKSISGRLSDNGVKAIIHMVTMHNPMDPTSIELCKSAIESGMEIIISDNYKSMTITAMGTGVGMLNKKEVAQMMIETLKKYEDKIEIRIVDIDEIFITCCKNFYGNDKC
jgi:O-acetyl-ADP-ribose deacetylase (regulator of RNase III)